MKTLTERDKQRARQLRDLAEAGDSQAAGDIWREFSVRIPLSKAAGAGPTTEEQFNTPATSKETIWHSSTSLPHAA
jgi:hypothetical protein